MTPRAPAAAAFTRRELAVMECLALGMTAKDTGRAVGESEEGIKSVGERARHRACASTTACLVDTAYRQQALTRPAPEALTFTVTELQQHGLRLVAAGCTRPQIARELRVGEAVIRTELRRLKAHSGARNAVHMVTRGWALGLLP